MTTYTRLTKAEARLWISEAWGRDISINNVKLRGDWLFVRDPEEDEDEVEGVKECGHEEGGGEKVRGPSTTALIAAFIKQTWTWLPSEGRWGTFYGAFGISSP